MGFLQAILVFQLKFDEGHIERIAFDVYMSWYKSSQVQCSEWT